MLLFPTLVVGDSHVNRNKRLDFNKELILIKLFFRSFSDANRIPTLVDEKPDVVLL